jgi:O-antigen ligase
MLAELHALVHVALLFGALALLVRRALGRTSSLGAIARTGFVTGLSRAYPWIVAAVTVWILIHLLAASLGLRHTVESVILLFIVMGCLWVAPRYPIAGPTAYLLLSYTFSRDDTVTVRLMNLDMPSWIPVLSVAALLVWLARHRDAPRLPSGWLVWSVALFAAWLGVSVLAAMVAGRPLEPDLTWRAVRYIQAVALFFVVAVSRPGLRDLRAMVLALSAALVIRQVFLTSAWLFEQNLAMLTVVTVPIALALAFCRPLNWLQMALVPLSGYMAAMILFVQNRGAIVGLGAACLGLWPLARRRWLGLLVLVTVPAAVAWWAFDAGWLQRFHDIYAGGHFLGTARQRLEIWSNGLAIAQHHWWFGVGPGNFESAIGARTAGHLTISAHNSIVELLVEDGAPAVVFYLVVFLAAAVHLARVAHRFGHDSRRTAAAGLLGVLAAHLAAGTFLDNPSLVWTWILIGVAASLPLVPASGDGDGLLRAR